MFEKAPNDPRELALLVGDTLVDVAQGLAAELDPAIPSLLVGHWMAEGPLWRMPDVMRGAEPVVDVERLEAQGWDCVLFGHNHVHQQLGPKSWSIGPPMRASFAEAENSTGFLELEWATESGWGVSVKHVPVEDRPLITFDVPVARALAQPGEAFDLADLALETRQDPFLKDVYPLKVRDAIVRVRYTCGPEEAKAMAAGPAQRVVDVVYAAGAFKVIGPDVTVLREERVARSDLDAEVDPVDALLSWLDENGVPENRWDAVVAEARRIMSGDEEAVLS
jgi:hypothetical protein